MSSSPPKTEICEGCENPEQRIVHAQYGLSLQAHGLSSRFCSSCLRAELLALGLATEHPDRGPVA